MGACTWRSTIRVDGKDMRGATKSTDHHPAAVMAEADVLHLRKEIGNSELVRNKKNIKSLLKCIKVSLHKVV